MAFTVCPALASYGITLLLCKHWVLDLQAVGLTGLGTVGIGLA